MGAHSDYRDGLLARFADRDALSKEELYQQYWAKDALSQAEVFELFDLIQQEYDISAGLLRPNDPIEKLTERVPEKRWWRGPIHDVIAGDRQWALEEELNRKMKKHGLRGQDIVIKTFDELVRVWCGCKP